MLLSSSSTRVALAAAAFSSAASSSTRASYSSRCRLASCRPAGRATTAATAATRRSVGAGLVAIGVGAATAGFPRGAAAKASRPDVENALKGIEWPAEPPFSREDFTRYDESDDALFYDAPRFVTHIDDAAIASLTQFYSEVFPAPGGGGAPGSPALLDLCSSWISHYPKNYKAARVTGLGMNAEELKKNAQLTESVVQDLNKDPRLPFEDDSFDVITNCVSVDYLTKPFEVFAEMSRVMRPGGLGICAFSNRMFPTKAVSLWTSTADADHARIIASFFKYSSDSWEAAEAKDITKANFFGSSGDPMYVVYARKRN